MGGRSTMAPRPPRPAAARSPPERCTDIIGDEHVDDCGTVVPTNDWFSAGGRRAEGGCHPSIVETAVRRGRADVGQLSKLAAQGPIGSCFALRQRARAPAVRWAPGANFAWAI
jgi:hypothetical protein